MIHIKEDVFISYRNDGAKQTAGRIYDALERMGYSVFYDVESLRAGDYNEQLFDKIDACTDFVLVLPPHALDRCVRKNDWVRKEIKHALLGEKNIIPFMLKGFEMPPPESLPPDIREVTNKHGIDASSSMFFRDAVKLLSREYMRAPKRKRYWKIFFSIIFSLLIALCVYIGIYVYNNFDGITGFRITKGSSETWNGEIAGNFGSGNGTKNSPYKISSAEQLARLSFSFHHDNTHMAGKYFELTDDIYLNETIDFEFDNMVINLDAPDPDPQNKYNIWTPIGSESNPFDGFFDGGGHTIIGMYMDDGELDYMGLFGYCTSDSVISNVTIDTAYINGNSYIGSVAGYSAGRLDNCTARNVTVTGMKYVGGIAGEGYFIINSGVFKVYLDSNYQCSLIQEDNFVLEQYLENECFGGMAGRCLYIVNSEVAYVYIEKPGYKSGALVGELIGTVYNTASDHAVISLYFPYHLYAKELHEAGLEFCYSDNIGCCTSPYADNGMETYAVLEFDGFSYQPNLHGWAEGEDERTLLRECFETYYPKIQVAEEAESADGGLLYRYNLNNHDIVYKNSGAQYNSLTKTGEIFSGNMNHHMETLPQSDGKLFSLLEKYEKDGGVFRKWVTLHDGEEPSEIQCLDGLIYKDDTLDRYWFL